MKDVLKIMLNGAYDNFKRIFFASDRVTDMEMRNAILNGEVQPTRKVNEELCVGCSGCANVCPTGAITMQTLQKPVKITENWTKTEVPVFNNEKCIVCYWCHDFCPIYALYGEAGAIHPNDVGESDIDPKELMSEPFKIDEEKLAFISQYLSDKSVLNQDKVATAVDKSENKVATADDKSGDKIATSKDNSEDKIAINEENTIVVEDSGDASLDNEGGDD